MLTHDNSMKLLDILKEQAVEVLDEALGGLQRINLTGYAHAGPDVTRQRLQKLLRIVTDGVENRDLGPMLAYAEAIARERYEGGYDLSEVQTAFNAIEEVLWKRIVRQLPVDSQAEALSVVSTILGAGKDALARSYVWLATRRGTPTLNLQSLFRGG